MYCTAKNTYKQAIFKKILKPDLLMVTALICDSNNRPGDLDLWPFDL